MKQYKISPKGFKAIKWTGENKEAIKEFINGEMNFLFNRNDVLTIYPNKTSLSLLVGDYLMKKADGNFFELEEGAFLEIFEEIAPVTIKKTQEREIAESIWKQINDKSLFEDELKIFEMGKRVSWVLRNEHDDMVEEAPFLTSQVKAELRKIFAENNVEI